MSKIDEESWAVGENDDSDVSPARPFNTSPAVDNDTITASRQIRG